MTTPLPPLQPPPRNLDSGSLENRVMEMGRWMIEVYRRMMNTGLLLILWTNLDFTGSRLSDILTRTHAMLQSILGADPTSSDTAQDKHVSNAQTLAWTRGISIFRSTAIGTTLLVTDEILEVTAAVTVVVPTAVGVAGKVYRIDSNQAGTVTVNPTGAQTIEGETSQTMLGQACMVLYSDGANWRFA